jgi:Flp pilus assembly protein TadD
MMRTISRPLAGLTALLGLTLSVTAPAFAGQSSAQAESRQAPQPQRVVMMCETDRATRQAFTREFGAPPVFVTAREAETARVSGQTWDTPRCMTAREHARLNQTLQARAGLN